MPKKPARPKKPIRSGCLGSARDLLDLRLKATTRLQHLGYVLGLGVMVTMVLFAYGLHGK